MQPLQNSSKPARRLCAEEVMGALPPVIWYMRRRMRGNRGGLSMPQFRALVRVEREPLTSITAIAEHLAASLSTTSRLVSGMVQRKFLAREVAPTDRRQARVSITPKGRAVLQAAREATGRELEAVFATLGSREHDKIIDAMRILRRLFGSGIAEPLTSGSAQPSNGHGRSTAGNRERVVRV
jgi:DNA-binding MarR family transcriptional regulator